MNTQYPSGAASLFAAHAREPLDLPEPQEPVVIPCTRCLSEDTEMVDHEHQIYRCRSCGETFERPPG